MSLWYPGAVRDLGPEWKVGYSGHRLRLRYENPTSYGQVCGLVAHSMEGELQAALARLDGSDLASWHVSNPRVEGLLQHYDMELAAWHAGYEANIRFVGVEHEGRAGEPLTSAQVDDLVDLIAFLAEEESWPNFKVAKDGTLQEHRWWMATACPSGRIPWATIIQQLDPQDEDPCALLRFNAAKWDECIEALQRNDGPVLVGWGKLLGG